MLKKRIMVVDDDKDIRRLVESILGKEGFVTVGAESGADALKKIQNSKPDLIILDLQLPDKDGFEVCKILRADPATRYIPVVFLTVQNLDSYKIGDWKSAPTITLMIPVWVEPNKIGHYEIACAQLCGFGHALMRADVYVDTPEDYEKWLQARSAATPAPPKPAKPSEDF
jgi:CheY-like chemotaxis protein